MSITFFGSEDKQALLSIVSTTIRGSPCAEKTDTNGVEQDQEQSRSRVGARQDLGRSGAGAGSG